MYDNAWFVPDPAAEIKISPLEEFRRLMRHGRHGNSDEKSCLSQAEQRWSGGGRWWALVGSDGLWWAVLRARMGSDGTFHSLSLV
jgi:hypothetical protein